jgi:hypothetical protein
MSPQINTSYASLVPVLSPQPVALADGGHVPTALEYVAAAECFLFDDGKTLQAWSDRFLPLWTIVPRATLNGWVVSGADLYVQDGAVICQFDLRALLRFHSADQAPVPANALNLATGDSWTTQTSGGPSFPDWCAQTRDSGYSPPVLWAGDPNRVFVLTAHGKVYPLPADLVEADRTQFVKLKAYPPDPDLPLHLCVPDGEPLHLQYLSSGPPPVSPPDPQHPRHCNLILLAQPSSGAHILFQREYPPAGGIAHWLAMSAAAAKRNSQMQSIRLHPEGSADPIFYCESSGPPAWQIFAFPNVVAFRSGGGCVICQLDSPGHTLAAAPMVMVPPDAPGAPLLYALTKDANNHVWLEQFKLPPATGAGSLAGAWPLVASQLGAIGPWLSAGASGAVMPLDPDSALVCYAAGARVLGFSRAKYVEQLPTAAARASRNMIEIAARVSSGDAANTTIHDVSAVPALLDAVAGFSYSVAELAVLLKKAGSPGVEVASTLLARGSTFGEVARVMRDAGFDAAEILVGARPACADPAWWAGGTANGVMINESITSYLLPSPSAEEAARTICGVGYTAETIANSFRHLGPRPEAGTYAAVTICRIMYGTFTAGNVQSLLNAAGHDLLNVQWSIKFIYNEPVYYPERSKLFNGDIPAWANREPFLSLCIN